MKPEPSNKKTARDTRRSLPFYFSNRFFAIFGTVSVFLLVAYVFLPSGLIVPLGLDAIVLLVAAVDFLSAHPPERVQIERLVYYPLAVDSPNEIPLEIRNRSSRTVSLLIRDDVPDGCEVKTRRLFSRVAANSYARVSYQLVPQVRGNARFGNIHYWLRGPMGLVWKHGEASAPGPVKLYPGLSLIGQAPMKVRPLSAQEMIRPVRRRGEGSEFDSLREYGVGDDSRLIHWGTTARKGKIIVRQNRLERGQTVFLVLDAGRMMTSRVQGKTKFDHGLNAALLLAYAALGQGDKVGMMVVARDVITFQPPSSAQAHFGRLMDATYSVEPRLEEPRFHVALADLLRKLRRRALVVLFTDLIDERASTGLLRYTLGLLPRHLPIVVAMTDTEVAEVADAEPREELDLYRQGVAAEILERRLRLLARLTSAGVLVVDAAPTKISAAVLDRYLDIKTRNLL
ncbi:MAG: DUF58 domain-containing protein [Desulfomonile tiedjei]|nr:DUF58 domain-containing protein [Desulfomonile tiedjei]